MNGKWGGTARRSGSETRNQNILCGKKICENLLTINRPAILPPTKWKFTPLLFCHLFKNDNDYSCYLLFSYYCKDHDSTFGAVN